MKNDDSPVRIDKLLQHTAWVRRLVRGFSRDDAVAADLEQETWLAVLRHPPTILRDTRAWLGRVARNSARQDVRGAARRARRERDAARPESVTGADELVERAELQRKAVAAVLALDEATRDTLLMHFFGELSAAEIGRRRGEPSSTVRNRIKRGLDRLRERFEREHPDGADRRKTLALLLLPFDGRPASGAPLAATARAKVWLVAGALLAVVGTAWVWTSTERAPDVPELPARVSSVPSFEVLAPSRPGPADRDGTREAQPLAPVVAVEPVFDGTVVDTNAAPVEGARIHVARFSSFSTQPVSIGVERMSDVLGRFSLPERVTAREGLMLVVEHPGFAPELIDLEERELVTLEQAGELIGKVVDEQTGMPLEGVRMTFGEYDWLDGAARETRTDANGSFRFDRAPAGRPVNLRLARPGEPFRSRRIPVAFGESRVELRLSVGVAVALRVVDVETGAGVADADLVVDFASVGRTGSDGSFQLRGVQRGQRHVVEARAEDRAPARIEVGVEAEVGERSIPVARECVLMGTVVGADGAPVPDARVALIPARERPFFEPALELPEGVRFTSHLQGSTSTRADETGAFRLERLAPWTRWSAVRISDPRSGRSFDGDGLRFERPGLEEERALAFPEGRASLQGALLRDECSVVGELSWSLGALRGDLTTDADGSFLLADLPEGTLTLTATIPELGIHESWVVALAADVALERTFELEGARTVLSGRVLDSLGAPVADLDLSAFDESRPGSRAKTSTGSDGAFRVELASPIGAPLTILTRNGPYMVSEYPVPAGTEDYELVLPELARLRLGMRGESSFSALAERPHVRFREVGSTGFRDVPAYSVVPSGDDAFELTLPTGLLDLSVEVDGYAATLLESVSVERGPTRSIPVSLTRKEG